MLLVGELANSLLYLFGNIMMVAPFSLDIPLYQILLLLLWASMFCPAVHTGLSVVCTNT